MPIDWTIVAMNHVKQAYDFDRRGDGSFGVGLKAQERIANAVHLGREESCESEAFA